MVKKRRFPKNKKPTTTENSYKPKTTVVSCSSCGKHYILTFNPETKHNLICVECFQKEHKKQILTGSMSVK